MVGQEKVAMEKMTSSDDNIQEVGMHEKGAEPRWNWVLNKVVRPCFVEFLGDMFFVFVGTMVTMDFQGAKHIGLGVGVAHGFTIFVLVAAMGHISGGHYNPAVTLGVFLSGNIQYYLAAGYVVSQLLGGICGAALCMAAVPEKVYLGAKGGTTLLVGNTTVGEGILIEAILTAVLVLVILMSAVDEEGKNSLAPLAIGSTIVICALAGGFFTGASMNPARTFGPALIFSTKNSEVAWKDHYAYWIAQIAGATLSASVYRIILASADKRLIGRRQN